MKLSELAQKLGGELIGDPEVVIDHAAPLGEADKGAISYMALNEYADQVLLTQASAVLVRTPVEGLHTNQIVCSDPYFAFAETMRMLYPRQPGDGTISPLAVVDDVSIGEGSTIMPYAVIGKGSTVGRNCIVHPHTAIGENVEIGDDVIIHSHVSIRENCRIGNRVILQNGCRIGSDGYGFAEDSAGRHTKIPQVGIVIIGDDVEIGANCCVDRATLTATRLGNGTKLDNLVQVGHNVVIGSNCLLVAQVGIAGSTKIGNGVTLAGQVGVSGHLEIGDGATVGGKSGVTRNIPSDEVYTGYPARPHAMWAKLQRKLRHLLESEDED